MALKPKSAEELAAEALGAENVANLERQFAALRADVARIAEVLAAMSETGAKTAKDAAAEAFAEFKAKGSDRLHEASTRAEDAMSGVTDFAKEKPLQALGLAAGLGMLLGLLLGRR